jgi:hypothetical protein
MVDLGSPKPKILKKGEVEENHTLFLQGGEEKRSGIPLILFG